MKASSHVLLQVLIAPSLMVGNIGVAQAQCAGTNTCFGTEALPSDSGGGNSAFGYRALNANTTGGSNTGLGADAL